MYCATYPDVQSEKNSVFRMCWTNMVHTCIYKYILLHHDKHTQRSQPLFTSNQALVSALRRRRVFQPRLNFPLRAAFFLSIVSLTVRPPRRGLQRPNCHSQGLTTMSPHEHCCPAFRQLQHCQRNRTGSLNPCACST